ncbi:hypothetical protein AVEN_140012-1 [Araneus ventricosus]|uniref:Uncharacterized protein n=1 Tax=Araneus ventricosus TaxID=182803 RepID=A0A4Y2U1P7_ARAVE|nr:hypothetical protein AVEN_140012-1 [Araneus ventricosus]
MPGVILKGSGLPSELTIRFRLCASLYCRVTQVTDFRSLCDLIVSDKIFRNLDRELMTHILVRQEYCVGHVVSGSESGGGEIVSSFVEFDSWQMIRNKTLEQFWEIEVMKECGNTEASL